MRWSTSLFLALLVTSSPAVTQADPLSYTYVEVAYLSTDLDDVNNSFEGAGVRLSLELTDELYLFGSYADQSADVYNDDFGEVSSFDVQSYAVGLGYAWPVSDVVDVYGQAAYVDGQAEWSGIEVDENGYAVAIGLRGRPSNRFELDTAVSYTDLDDEAQAAVGAAAHWYFTDYLAVGLNVSLSERGQTYGAGLRWAWGRNQDAR